MVSIEYALMYGPSKVLIAYTSLENDTKAVVPFITLQGDSHMYCEKMHVGQNIRQ